MTPTVVDTPLPTTAEPRLLPSGRSVVLRVGAAGEEIEVRSPEGVVEVQIVLTEQGPVVRLSAARLELAAVEEVRLTGKKIALQGSEQIEATTAGELRLRSEGDAHLNGKMLYLNCE